MKATQDFELAFDETGAKVSFRRGYPNKDLKIVKVKKGDEIPSNLLKGIVESNLGLVDVKYEFRRPVNLPKEVYSPPEAPTTMKIKKRKYTQNSLTKIRNEGGFPALKKIGEEFGVTDRSSKRLITEILKAQEERQRKGL